MSAKRFCAVMSSVAVLGVLALAQPASAQKTPQPGTNITVSKTPGAAMHSTIQAAVNAALPGQVIEILDVSEYEEQVTIDGRPGGVGEWGSHHRWPGVTGEKHGITIRYVPAPGVGGRPTIKYHDLTNQSPKNRTEAQTMGDWPGTAGNFNSNGALRIIRTSGVTIEGIIVDGGGSAPFVNNAVWCSSDDGIIFTCYDNTHGNAAITINISSNVQIRDCEIRNAFAGIYVGDRNPGGVFANPNPSDNDVTIPLSNFGKMGNHLIEYNKIANNEAGIYIESMWDLGSTIRHNLIYNNYRRSAITSITSDGDLAAGGIRFKDNYLTPLAIYNNTFFDNDAHLIGLWQVGYQHLIFNNIFSRISQRTNTLALPNRSTALAIEHKFINRMKHCVFSAGANPKLGLAAFPNDANVNQIETAFLSLESTSPNFLVPNWDNNVVKLIIGNGGWKASGIVNENGETADLGAIPQSGKRPCDDRVQTSRARITPTDVIRVSGVTATAGFIVSSEIGTLDNLKIKYARWIAPIPDNKNSWADEGAAVPASAVNDSIRDLAGKFINPGFNYLDFTLPQATASAMYGFLEIAAEGLDGIGRPITTDVGFLPYRLFAGHYFKMEAFDKGGNPVNAVTVGEPVTVRVSAMLGSAAFTGGNGANPLDVSYNLLSDPTAFMWREMPAADPLTRDDLRTGGAYTKTYTVYFTKAGNEVVSAAGMWCSGSCDSPTSSRVSFLGNLPLTVRPGAVGPDVQAPVRVVFLSPISKSQLPPGAAAPVLSGFYSVEVQVRDAFGNGVSEAVNVTLASGNTNLGVVVSPVAATDPATGIARFIVVAGPGASSGGEFELTASINHGGVSASDAAALRVRGADVILLPARPKVVGGKYLIGSGSIYAARLTFDRDVTHDWFSSMEFAFGHRTRGTMDNMGCIMPDAGDARSVSVILSCGFPGTNFTEAMGDGSRVTINYNAMNGWAPQTVNFAGIDVIAVREHDRVIPPPQVNAGEASVIPSVLILAGELTVGPNPVNRSAGIVNFYRVGTIVPSASRLTIYNASGHVVNKIRITDKTTPDDCCRGGNLPPAAGVQSRRLVGTWDLKDRRGRPVADGSYLVKGEIRSRSGERERVSVVLGVR